MKFPYGISDFYTLRTEGYIYIDRTEYIPIVEAAGKQLIYLRPRRFGKSLWLSTLENYYDVAKAAEFTQLFGDLAIGHNPTPNHNRYFILRWDFSLVSAQGGIEEIGKTLHNHINGCIENFAVRYHDLLSAPITLYPNDSVRSFQSLLTSLVRTPYKLYLLIDEYDNFANEILMSGISAGSERYKALLYGEGLLKTIFKAVKAAGGGMGLERAFTTGVAPVVLSDLSSGYNVARNITLEQDLDTLCGFTEIEIHTLLAQISRERGLPTGMADTALQTMRAFYNGYAFGEDVGTVCYNPTLALYFLQYLSDKKQPPRELLDNNLAMDRGKIAYIAGLTHGAKVIAATLNPQDPPTLTRLARSFGVEDMLTQVKDMQFMVSLLYYFGVLTLDQINKFGELVFRIPNLVARKLYVEQLREHLLPEFSDRTTAAEAARELYQTGDLEPLCEFIETHYFRVLDNRDYRWANELTVKMAFLTLLFDDMFYITDSEPALDRSYADMTLIARPDMRKYALQDILLEFKYVSLSDLGMSNAAVKAKTRTELAALPLIATALAEAMHQAERYQAILQDVYGEQLNLHTYAVVALGFDRLVWRKLTD
ncbi:MAG: AAA family ATPase [Anaerolineae bacterium]|nr:AAA family ATPase [Anaerolineae bacterium]